ncbi:MAG: ZIP family metal transporter [Gemmatimonadales bacterium]
MALVFVYGLITAIATGLGALPFAFVRTVSRSGIALSHAVASGLMLGASFGLMLQGTAHGSWQTIVGANVGVLFILATQQLIKRHNVRPVSDGGRGLRRTLLMLAVMTVHSFSEGVAVGASFAGGLTLAALITIAIAVHNIPEGLAISAVMRPQGSSVMACAGWSIFSSLPQPLMAVPAFLFVSTFQPFLSYGIGFAAGAMVLMVFLDLLPEAFEGSRRPTIGIVVSVSLVAMTFLQQYF